MRRILIMVMALILASIACLGSDESPTNVPSNQTFATVTRPPTVVPGAASPTPFGQINATVFPTSTTSGVVGPVIPPSNCTIPAGWQAYIVRAGDTLNVLASSIGSSVDILQTGNCLTNANAIFVGQTLYLPNVPALVPTTAPTNATTITTCAIPVGWQPYVVQSGDTLSLIAIAIGSTVQTIQTANCITDADTILVGQTLYLPNLPARAPTANPSIPTPTTAPALTVVPTGNRPPTFIQLLRVSPTQLRNDGALMTTQRTISLDVGVVNDADNVRYFAGTSATDQNPVLVAIDTDPFDGTRVNYTLADFDTELFFIAVAENETGFASSNIVHVVYDPNYNANVGSPVLTPFLSFNGTIYTLQPNTNVSVSWASAPLDATRIEFYYLPTGGAAPQVIGTDGTPSNGALVTWLVPLNLNGQVFARAIFDGRIQDSSRVGVSSGQ